MPSNRLHLNNILVVSLTNIGDVVLTLPVVDAVHAAFPRAKLSLIIGPKAGSLFTGHPHFHRVEIFDKHKSLWKKYQWVRQFKRERFDCVVDLRHTVIPWVLGARCKTSFWRAAPAAGHMRHRHWARLRTLVPLEEKIYPRFAVHIPEEVRHRVGEQWGLGREGDPFVVIAPGAAALEKRWDAAEFAELAARLQNDYQRRVVIVGHAGDKALSERVSSRLDGPALDLTGQTSLLELAEIFSLAELAVVNDSGPMHLASYMNCPLVAMFGPSDPAAYGPWSRQSLYLDQMSRRTHQDVLEVIVRGSDRLSLKNNHGRI
jgi:ADP-heptose:LPS heptosyltransferase